MMIVDAYFDDGITYPTDVIQRIDFCIKGIGFFQWLNIVVDTGPHFFIIYLVLGKGQLIILYAVEHTLCFV